MKIYGRTQRKRKQTHIHVYLIFVELLKMAAIVNVVFIHRLLIGQNIQSVVSLS